MNFDQLVTSLRDLDGSLKSHVAQSANVGLTLRNWLVGAYIVEFEQNGEERAEYGDRLISEVAKQLQVRGLPPTTLRLCRSLYLGYPQIQQTVSVKSRKPLDTRKSEIRQTVSGEFGPGILQTLSAIFGETEEAIPQTLSGKFRKVLADKGLNIPQTSAELDRAQRSQPVSDFSPRPEFALQATVLFQKLTFSHFVELLRPPNVATILLQCSVIINKYRA